jgi:hypothetical protein
MKDDIFYIKYKLLYTFMVTYKTALNVSVHISLMYDERPFRDDLDSCRVRLIPVFNEINCRRVWKSD